LDKSLTCHSPDPSISARSKLTAGSSFSKLSTTVLLVWIVGPAKIFVHRDGLDDPHNGLGANGGDAKGDNSMAVGHAAAEFII
jgi:hypothetical protein